MKEDRFYTYEQTSAYKSPRPFMERFVLLVWNFVWWSLCSWTPQPLNVWRLFWLRLFGCRTSGRPFVHQRARIEVPWNLTLEDRACLGDRASAYSMGPIELKARSTIAQEAYLCTATHKMDDPNLPLQTAKITVGEDAFLAARVFVLPGITIGEGAVIGVCSVVTEDMPEWTVCFGNPCRPVKSREFKRNTERQ